MYLPKLSKIRLDLLVYKIDEIPHIVPLESNSVMHSVRYIMLAVPMIFVSSPMYKVRQ
ncbi:hypothetical protein GIB67_037089 [Kingdonia uniflora]|uniref:Uncharacterized protein n=1 Tax=Kingdonia uniflora TaxID=39325 RepID=A0A7J7LHM6_9MAGN|nr:hypothetical protein GIB67_037089 [Kingdonia uniflora]